MEEATRTSSRKHKQENVAQAVKHTIIKFMALG